MYRVAMIRREALASTLPSLAARMLCPLALENGMLRPAHGAAGHDDTSPAPGRTVFPSPLTYRLAELSMSAYDDPRHHSAAADMLATRDRSLFLAAFRGDQTAGSQAEWSDRLVGFVQLGLFVRREGRSFFSSARVLAFIAGGDHFLSGIAALADDAEVVAQAVDDLMAGNLRGREVDCYISDLVIPERRALPLLIKKIEEIKATPGVGGLAAVLVPARSLVADDGRLARRMERRARLLNMERIAVCPPLNDQEAAVGQEFWLGREVPTAPLQRGYARMRVWLDRHPSIWLVVPALAFLAGLLVGVAVR